MLFADCFHGAAHNMLGDVGLELMNVVSDSDNALNSVLSVFDSSPIELWTDWRERIIMCVFVFVHNYVYWMARFAMYLQQKQNGRN